MRLRIVLTGALLGACAPPPAAPALLAGGETTSADRTSSAFENPSSNLDEAALAAHWDGDSAFSASFVTPPAPLNAGLGPLFNNTACSGCHIRNGRGLPIAGAGARRSSVIVQLSHPDGASTRPGGPLSSPSLGEQLQDHATLGAEAEGQLEIAWIEELRASRDRGARVLGREHSGAGRRRLRRCTIAGMPQPLMFGPRRPSGHWSPTRLHLARPTSDIDGIMNTRSA